MAKKHYRRFEKNIYVEERSGSFRFKVDVSPHKDSATFSTEAEGASWARRRRLEFLEIRESGHTLPFPATTQAVPAYVGFPFAHHIPAPIKLADVFDEYGEYDLPKLTGKQTEKSRLLKLQEWFGECTVDQLDERFIDRWKADRLVGKLGSGRDPNRGETMLGENGKKPLTKHQRYYRKTAGKDVPAHPIHPVSTQTVRHELSLLRRAVSKYLDRENRWSLYGAWWQAHYLKRMKLPDAAEPRSRRVSDAELKEIFNGITDMRLKAAILFAVLTSLRRGEVVSLKWEDVDFERKVVRLRKPIQIAKSKIQGREIPLLEGAIKLLQDLKPKKRGAIFEIPASDVSHAWRDAADKAEIFDARLHDCRREAISRLVESCGLSVHEVVMFSGHSDIGTLQKHYLRLDAGRMASRLAENPNAVNMAPSLQG